MTAERPKVVYWNNYPSPYMVDRWNAVAEAGKIDLEVWLSARTASDRSWEIDESDWSFRYQYLPTLSLIGRSIPVPTPLFRSRPDVVVSLYAEPWFLFGWAIAKMKRIKTSFWVESTSDAWVRRYKWKEALKRWLFPRTDGLITTGPSGRAFCRRYNVPDERIHEAMYGIDVDYFRTAADEKRSCRDAIRSRLGVQGTTFLYVGRYWWGKGLDTLFDAYAELRRSRNDVSLLLVGDGEDEQRLRARCADESIEGVVIESFKQRDILPEMYVASDVFVFPTLGDTYGMVVDEAMASSLPIIATSVAGEIRVRVEDGANGFLVSSANSAALCAKMKYMADNPALRHSMGVESLHKIAGNTPALFAENFEAAIREILAT